MTNCNSCKHYSPSVYEISRMNAGLCHRYPPVLTYPMNHGEPEDVNEISQDPEKWSFPFVRDSSFCGEFQSKEEQ